MTFSLLQRFLQTPTLHFYSEGFRYGTFDTPIEYLTNSTFHIPDRLMIGKQAEYCFEHYLQYNSRYQRVASNIQIQGKEATKGELDYIVFDQQTEQHLHIELACKFYLYDEQQSRYARWTGPNRTDSLDQKIEKLKKRQFPLLHATETSSILASLSLDSLTISQQLCLKAFLFIPKGMLLEDVSEAYRSSIVGQWMNKADLMEEDPKASYVLPKKTDWLRPSNDLAPWISLKELLPLVEEQHAHKKTPLVYQKSNRVLKLFFIVWWK